MRSCPQKPMNVELDKLKAEVKGGTTIMPRPAKPLQNDAVTQSSLNEMNNKLSGGSLGTAFPSSDLVRMVQIGHNEFLAGDPKHLAGVVTAPAHVQDVDQRKFTARYLAFALSTYSTSTIPRKHHGAAL